MTSREGTIDRTALLAELRADTSVDASGLDRVRRRVTATLNAAHLAALGQVDTLVPQPALPTRLLRGTWAGAAAALVVGSALGAGGHALVSSLASAPSPSPAPARQATRTPVAAPAGLVSARPSERLESPPASQLAQKSLKTRTETNPVARASAGLDAELQQLELARSALAQGQAGQALQTLDGHARLFPTSLLGQERDALKVKALVSAGRYAEARAAGGQFTARYPQGLLTDSVQASLATIP